MWGSGPNDVFVVGNHGTILHSSDGQTFTQMPSGVSQSIVLRAVWGTGPTNVYVAGDAGHVLHYDGTVWRRVTLRSAEAMTTVIGTSSSNIFIAGSGAFWHFDGVSWAKQALPTQVAITGASTVGDSLTFVGVLGTVLSFDHTVDVTERRCGDAWDNDADGAINCADADCASAPECASGGACVVEADLARNQSRPGSSYSGFSRIDDAPCLGSATDGPEVTYRVAAPGSGQVTIALEDLTGAGAQLFVADANTVASACDLTSCSPASGNTITVPATGQQLYVIVDAPAGMGASFTITTTCE